MIFPTIFALVAAMPQLVPVEDPNPLFPCNGFCDQEKVTDITHSNLVEKASTCIQQLQLNDTSFWAIKGKFHVMNYCGIVGPETCTCPGIGERIQSVMRELASDKNEKCVGLCRGEPREPTKAAFDECIKTRTNRDAQLTKCFLDQQFHLYGNCDIDVISEIDYALMLHVQL
jgi:hypothetical protein